VVDGNWVPGDEQEDPVKEHYEWSGYWVENYGVPYVQVYDFETPVYSVDEIATANRKVTLYPKWKHTFWDIEETSADNATYDADARKLTFANTEIVYNEEYAGYVLEWQFITPDSINVVKDRQATIRNLQTMSMTVQIGDDKTTKKTIPLLEAAGYPPTDAIKFSKSGNVLIDALVTITEDEMLQLAANKETKTYTYTFFSNGNEGDAVTITVEIIPENMKFIKEDEIPMTQTKIKDWKQAWEVYFADIDVPYHYKTVDVFDGECAEPLDPEPVKEGYIFDKWDLIPFVEGEAQREEYDFTTPVRSHILLDATWIETHIVTFDFNDETTEPAEVKVADGEALPMIPEVPIREGYAFIGWFDKETDEAFDFETPIEKDYELYAEWEQKAVWFEPSLSIDEAIGMRVYIHLPEGDDPADYTVKRVYHSKYQDLDHEYTVGDLDWNNGYLLRISENASDEMSDEATVTVYYKGEEVAKENFSIRSIAYDWLNQGKNVGILNAMLQYGAKAQVQFNYKADDLPEAPNPPALVAIPDTYAPSGDPTTMDNYLTMDTGLNLESRVCMRFYFKPAESLGVDDFEFSVKDRNGRGAKFSKPVMKNGEIFFEVTNIDPNEMGFEYSITATLKADTSKTATWKRSIMNNAYKLQEKGVAKDLLMALYQYSLEANKLWPN
jgi:uncharacterized repeat protein (TIGR02543 family)